MCGFARGYNSRTTDGFTWRPVGGWTINQTYVDGLSITYGNPRQHLWTMAAGCSSSYSNANQIRTAPSFIANHLYCDTNNPLWYKGDCLGSSTPSCNEDRWFHRVIEQTQADIEVRWCCDEPKSNEDIYTDLLEIWVS